MSAQFTLFDLATRKPIRCVTCRSDWLVVPEGQIAIEGHHRGAVRLNAENKPEPDQERARIAEREQRRSARQARIEELERKQARRVREILAASDPQLKEIDDEIAQLRAKLADGT